jgi:hypothetical protein
LLLLVLAFSLLPAALTFGHQRFNARLDTLASQLVRQARDAADRIERDYRQGFNNNRRDLQRLYQARMFVAGAELLAQMTREGRPDDELLEAVDFLRSQANFETGWSSLRSTLDDIGRELRFGSSQPGLGPGNGRQRGRRNNDGWQDGYTTGRMRWFGRVDDEIYIYVQGSTARTQVISGQPTLNERFTFTSPLPRQPLTVMSTACAGVEGLKSFNNRPQITTLRPLFVLLTGVVVQLTWSSSCSGRLPAKPAAGYAGFCNESHR